MNICYICRQISGHDVSFHRFPKNEERLASWFHALGISALNVKHAFVCSSHFTEDSFYITPTGKRTLKKEAVPSENFTHYRAHDLKDSSTSSPITQPTTSRVPEDSTKCDIRDSSPTRSEPDAVIHSLSSSEDEDVPEVSTKCDTRRNLSPARSETDAAIYALSSSEDEYVPEVSTQCDTRRNLSPGRSETDAAIYSLSSSENEDVPEVSTKCDSISSPTRLESDAANYSLNASEDEDVEFVDATLSMSGDDDDEFEEVIEIHVYSESDESDRESEATAPYPTSDTLTTSETNNTLVQDDVSPQRRRKQGTGNTLSDLGCAGPNEIEENFQKLRAEVDEKSRVLKTVQQKFRRSEKRVESLKTAVAALRKKLRIAKNSKSAEMENTEIHLHKKLKTTNKMSDVDFESVLYEKENLKFQIERLLNKNDELSEEQINYETVDSENHELQIKIDALKVENQKLKTMLGQSS